ncbi:MAG: CoA transferase [Burkholderiaceae bacterium]
MEDGRQGTILRSMEQKRRSADAMEPDAMEQPQRDAREIMITTIATLLAGIGHVAVGASSPIPAAGAMLARHREPAMRISILGSPRHNFFTNGSAELFDCAGQGRIGAFFLGGGQIDGEGNVNLVGAGDYPASTVRWPGSFGSAYLYYVVPRVILFREEHSRRVFVPRVDFISAAGASAPGVHRRGGPHALLTPLALFDFDRTRHCFRLRSVHPGHTLEEVADQTGFAFDRPDAVPTTAGADSATRALLYGPVRDDLAAGYPAFAAALGAGALGCGAPGAGAPGSAAVGAAVGVAGAAGARA